MSLKAPSIYTKEKILQAIDPLLILEEIERGLVCYSQKQTITSPIGFLHFDEPPADVHIKSGAILDNDLYVVKIASSFYENPAKNLPSSNGLMLLFSQKTGELLAILQDEGYLTDLRTGLAGAIAAKYLCTGKVEKIGILGTGTQARHQLQALQWVTSCRQVLVWGRNAMRAGAFCRDPDLANFQISAAKSIDQIAEQCNLIVTTTPSSHPLLFGHQIRPGTHITAVGADGPGKQEIDSSLFERADLIAVDSYAQCRQYGDLSHVDPAATLPLIELGELIARKPQQNLSITIADLTGVAVEDLQIAKAVYARLLCQ
ncbi:MAG: deaminase [Verrucomicrobiota bacterium]|nr:deaminase [Verrucomicrobiota bacterium]